MFLLLLLQIAAIVNVHAETISDRLWLWAHPAGAYGNYFDGPPYNGLRSRITPVEAAVSMDIHSIMFIWENQPYTNCTRGSPPKSCYPQQVEEIPQYLVPFRAPFFRQTAFSISGSPGVHYPSDYEEAIYKALPSLKNSAGVVFDDFVYSNPESLQMLKGASKEMSALGKDVFLCVYTRELEGLTPYLEHAARPMMWTSNVSEIINMEQNWAKLEKAMDKAGGRDKFKPMLGIYMWDYLTYRQEVPPALMEHQLSVALKLLRSGRAHDVIFLGSTIVDLELRGVERSREWIAAYKDEPLTAAVVDV